MGSQEFTSFDKHRYGMASEEFNELVEHMHRIPSEEFAELVRLSTGWSDLARQCGYTDKYKQSISKMLKRKVLSLKLDTQHFTSKNSVCQMYRISPKEFTDFVRESTSWSDLARRCGQPLRFGRFCSTRCLSILKQKVVFMKLDTQHFTSNGRIEDAEDQNTSLSV